MTSCSFHVCLDAQSCMTLCGPMDCSPPGFSVHGIFRQEYWSGLPFPAPGDLPDAGIQPMSLGLLHWQVGSLSLAPPGKPTALITIQFIILKYFSSVLKFAESLSLSYLIDLLWHRDANFK